MGHGSSDRKKHWRLRPRTYTYSIHAKHPVYTEWSNTTPSSSSAPNNYPPSLMLFNATAPSSAPACPTKNWEPDTTLGLIHPMRGLFTCTGYAPSSGRRCIEPVRSFGDGRAVLGKLAKLEIPEALENSAMMKEAASFTLCHQHRWQATDISRQWGSLLRARAAKLRAGAGMSPAPKARTTTASFESTWNASFETKGNFKVVKTEYDSSKQLLEDLLWVIDNLLKVIPGQLPRNDMTLQELQCFLEAQLVDQERSKRLLEEKLEEQEQLKREQLKRELEDRAKAARAEQKRRLAEEQQRMEAAAKATEAAARETEEAAAKETEAAARKTEEAAARETEAAARETEARAAAKPASETNTKTKAKTETETEAWAQVWKRYDDGWNRIRMGKPQQGAAEQCIPWPVKSGQLADVNAANIRQFFKNAPPQHLGDTAEDLFRFLNAENKRWHTDKLMQNIGSDVVNGELKEALSTITQVLIQLRQRAQSHRRK